MAGRRIAHVFGSCKLLLAGRPGSRRLPMAQPGARPLGWKLCTRRGLGRRSPIEHTGREGVRIHSRPTTQSSSNRARRYWAKVVRSQHAHNNHLIHQASANQSPAWIICAQPHLMQCCDFNSATAARNGRRSSNLDFGDPSSVPKLTAQLGSLRGFHFAMPRVVI